VRFVASSTGRCLGSAYVTSNAEAASWHGPRTGKTGVASFFADLGSGIEISGFTPHHFAAGEADVHLLVDWGFRSIATGHEASMTMHHYWGLRDGKVEYFRGSEDTELTIQAFAA
jgi:ketosteroid isomerase-like protein